MLLITMTASGGVLSGLVVALATQLVLSAGWRYWDGLLSDSGAPRSNAGGVGTGVGIISLLIFIRRWLDYNPCLWDR